MTIYYNIKIIWAFIKRDVISEASYKLSFFLQLLSILPLILMFYYLSRLIGDKAINTGKLYGCNYFPFVLIGIAVQNYLTIALNSFSNSIRESQLSGTIEAVMVTPVSLPTFLCGSAAYSFILNSFRIFIYLILGRWLFDLKFYFVQAPVVFLIIFLTITSFISFGILSASFIILFKKGDPLNWGFNVISWLLGGVYYPVSILPKWLQEIAQFIPITHSLEALRLSILGNQGFFALWHHILILGLFSIFGLSFSYLCFRFAINISKSYGSLGHY